MSQSDASPQHESNLDRRFYRATRAGIFVLPHELGWFFISGNLDP